MLHKLLLDQLWDQYIECTPSALKIHKFLEREGNTITNDHIAFRTFNLPGVDIDSMAEVFIAAGYQEKGGYYFEQKRLNAKHYEHISDKKAPKIFISELQTENFSLQLQKIVNHCISQVQVNKDVYLPFLRRQWENISYETYEKLREESEYCAWVYVYGFCVNHFTVLVNDLSTIDNMESMNNFLKENGFQMNTSGGEIKGTPEELLEQSSIMADKLPVEFIEGTFEVPSCYYEFAMRYKDINEELYSGFIAKSADKIFESTDVL